MKKVLCGAMAVAMTVSFVGCGNKAEKGKTEDGKTLISIYSMPDKDKNPESYEKWEAKRLKFMEENPDVHVEGDSWGFSNDTFSQKAAADQLPTYFYMPFTEAKKCYTNGYMKNITPWLEKYGYLENYADSIKELTKAPDGNFYCVADYAYVLGLLCNKEMFEKADLVNADGTIKIPQTFDEMAESASKIKKATGSAGFTIPTKNCAGGWMFMNLARSFGVVFMEEGSDGKWTAKFNDENGVAALQYLKDLKWKYDAVSNNALIDNAEMHKMLATGQTASMFAAGLEPSLGKTLCVTNGMDMNNLVLGQTPAGPKGRYALMGGSIKGIPAIATDDQADAAMRWHAHEGKSPNMTDAEAASLEITYQDYVEQGIPIIPKEPYSVWKSGNNIEKVNEVRAKYSQVDYKNFEQYYTDLDKVIIVPEEPYYCQELYSLLDGCIQEVFTNKNADVQQLLNDAVQNFQVNYLDKLEV